MIIIIIIIIIIIKIIIDKGTGRLVKKGRSGDNSNCSIMVVTKQKVNGARDGNGNLYNINERQYSPAA